MAYQVYDIGCRRVMTIAVCNTQSEDREEQCIMWRSLNEVIRCNGMVNTNFKGFMADIAQVNWNVVRIIYGKRNPKIEMLNRK